MKVRPARIPWATRRLWVRWNYNGKTQRKDPEDALKLERKIKMLRDFKHSKTTVQLMHRTRSAPQPPSAMSRQASLLVAHNEHDKTPPVSESDDDEEEGQSDGGEDLKVVWAELDEVIDKLELEAMDKRSQPFTVVDYLSLKPPRTMQKEEILRRLIPGHSVRGTPEELIKMAKASPNVPAEDVWGLDWYGPKTLSHRGKLLHMRMDDASLVAADLDVSAGGRTSAFERQRSEEPPAPSE